MVRLFILYTLLTAFGVPFGYTASRSTAPAATPTPTASKINSGLRPTPGIWAARCGGCYLSGWLSYANSYAPKLNAYSPAAHQILNSICCNGGTNIQDGTSGSYYCPASVWSSGLVPLCKFGPADTCQKGGTFQIVQTYQGNQAYCP